ncbi:mechanosensitive ion channel family protein [Aetokthonos hydrillicola Thurmond2011]|jgi:small conductance mechanosensitive channel|uniref:Mechanosensitive ion channel family protein n=1 Tax=Aetokthonos hydrillicola Thurmond2011 TaxID=2712845 RepID=A0AAP5I927_9CYAN|nr:mechanosensitive ion channel family protein [Aetokthonos hydrillicola]MBO3459489.1 mechanosensitive ion channel family protein [Aetokthonos hydrillicola CCALA 1050]MBW4583852.1 mechanosensitive ion channel family protein [Aetokthonos hydrillicola CCALA 1050]MDR9895453.1 mechanosensitive ion channel family protein [Aetokthonos hydrillicola Thurmond2011]
MNIIIILCEVIFLILIFSLLNLVIGIIFKQISKSYWVQGRSANITFLRRSISRILILTSVILSLAVIGVNGMVIYRGGNVQEFQLNLIHSLPAQFWTNLLIAGLKSVSLLMLVKLTVPPLSRGINWVCNYAKSVDQIKANDESIEAFFKVLKRIIIHTLWIYSVILSAQFFHVPKVIPNYLYIALKIYIIITVGLLIVKAVATIVDTLDALSLKYSSSSKLLNLYERLRHLIPLFKKCLQYVLYIGIVNLVVPEIEPIAWISAYTPKIVQIIGVYFLSNVLIEVAYFFLDEFYLRSADANANDSQEQKRLTLIPLMRNFTKYFVYFTAGVTILKLIGIDPAPILAGAGIVGIAVGLGAQNLINDVVCGFLILFENYYLVGDYIEIGKLQDRGIEGTVEAIELRTTHVRHPDGQLQIIRNGEIGAILNFSKQYIYARVEVSVSYHSNLDHVYRVLEKVGEQLKAHEDDVIEPTRVAGIENFGDNHLLLLTLTKVKPGKHLHIQRVLRKILRDAFSQEEIELCGFSKN